MFAMGVVPVGHIRLLHPAQHKRCGACIDPWQINMTAQRSSKRSLSLLLRQPWPGALIADDNACCHIVMQYVQYSIIGTADAAADR